MDKYIIAIEETVVEQFEVEADNSFEALNIVKEKYKKGEFVICLGEVQSKQIAVVKPLVSSVEWSEF